jgi:deoxyribonuclease V
MQVRRLHAWVRTYRAAVALQERLRAQVRLEPLQRAVRLVAGVDVAYAERAAPVYAGIVVLRLPDFEVVEEVVVCRRATFPYLPGLLTFREGPAVLAAFRRLRHEPDAVLFDGQGVAHPRRLGLATHLGLWLNRPSVGCAKSRLVGEHESAPPERGARVPLTIDGAVVGAVLRTRAGVKPMYVSPGTLIDVAGAVDLVMACCAGFRVPEPTRRAHALVTRARRFPRCRRRGWGLAER